MSWEDDAAEVNRLVDAARTVTEPTPEAIQRALGISLPTMTRLAMWMQLSGTLDRGPVERVELSYRPDLGSGTVTFHARASLSPPLLREMMDLDRFGPRPMPENNLVPPEGVLTYAYDVERGAKTVSFQFTAHTHKLTFASVAWAPRPRPTPATPAT